MMLSDSNLSLSTLELMTHCCDLVDTTRKAVDTTTTAIKALDNELQRLLAAAPAAQVGTLGLRVETVIGRNPIADISSFDPTRSSTVELEQEYLQNSVLTLSAWIDGLEGAQIIITCIPANGVSVTSTMRTLNERFAHYDGIAIDDDGEAKISEINKAPDIRVNESDSLSHPDRTMTARTLLSVFLCELASEIDHASYFNPAVRNFWNKS